MPSGCQCIEEETVVRYIDEEDCKIQTFVNVNVDNLDDIDDEEREDHVSKNHVIKLLYKVYYVVTF